MTFWSLSLYDLRVPNEQYEIEVAKLQRIAEDADLNPDLVRLPTFLTLEISDSPVSLSRRPARRNANESDAKC